MSDDITVTTSRFLHSSELDDAISAKGELIGSNKSLRAQIDYLQNVICELTDHVPRERLDEIAEVLQL